jgi:SET domain
MPDLQSVPSHFQNRCPQSPQSNQVRVVEDRTVYGARLIANRPFKRGDLILPLMGKTTAPSYRTIQVGERTHIEGPLLAFMNHSCRPSAIVVTCELAVRAWTALKVGEEVTFFYPSTEWKMVRPFDCLCGAPDCIRHVAGAEDLPVDLLARYHVNFHIRKLASRSARAGGSVTEHLA